MQQRVFVRWLVGIAVALRLVAPATAQLDEGAVRAAYDDARAAVAEVLGTPLDPVPPLRFVAMHELGQRVADENLPLVARREPDEDAARREADVLGAQYARFAFAKYSWSSKEFLVVLPTWIEKARQFDRIELLEDEAVRAVLVHELVHALDDRAHDIGRALLACDSDVRIQGFNAVLEGHAQFQARRVSAARGWSDGFTAYTTLIDAIPPGLDEAALTLARVQAATVGSAYNDGERFVAALVAREDPELLTRAFRTPPDVETIFHPEWFVDPSTRPLARFDAAPALEQLRARYPAEDWTAQQVALTPAQVGAALALLPPDEVARIVASLRASSMLLVQPKAAPGSAMAVLGVMEFTDEAAARAYQAAARALNRIKDERMREGQVRIVSARYEEWSEDEMLGFLGEKTMAMGKQEFPAATIDLTRGPLVLETVFSNVPIESAAHRELARAALAAVKPR